MADLIIFLNVKISYFETEADALSVTFGKAYISLMIMKRLDIDRCVGNKPGAATIDPQLS